MALPCSYALRTQLLAGFWCARTDGMDCNYKFKVQVITLAPKHRITYSLLVYHLSMPSKLKEYSGWLTCQKILADLCYNRQSLALKNYNTHTCIYIYIYIYIYIRVLYMSLILYFYYIFCML
jgi:hypothetical protein